MFKGVKNINDDSEILKDVKELIIQLLYNKRHIVLKTKELLEHIDETDENTIESNESLSMKNN